MLFRSVVFATSSRERRSASWPGALRASPGNVETRENLVRGESIRNAEDRPRSTSRLRGAARSTDLATASEPAWVDARLLAWCEARRASRARGRRPGVTPVAAPWDRPWGGATSHTSRPEASVTAEVRDEHERASPKRAAKGGKGAASVAERAPGRGRDPRPSAGVSGGSSGGQTLAVQSDRAKVGAGAPCVGQPRPLELRALWSQDPERPAGEREPSGPIAGGKPVRERGR